jgi:glycosyltransferase involved in cell wall biosynthesis
MNILFVHQNYPAQFGHIAQHLVKHQGDQCSFVSLKPPASPDGVQRVVYQPVGGATAQTHYCTRTFENAVAHAHGVYQACKAQKSLRPDLIVGHSGFGSTLFLRELFNAPIINYFEYFYRPHGSDLDFRPEFPPAELDILRSYCRNAMILLDLQNADAGYSPTRWQRNLLPAQYHDRVRPLFDGVDTAIWHPAPDAPRSVAGRQIPNGMRIVTYVSRGFESMRGFDVFMKAAKIICQADPRALFIVVGSDRVVYGGDLKHVKARSFREHVLAQDQYDLSRIWFVGTLPPHELARLWAIADLHIYLTVPFVLSWSLFNALACRVTVLASDTEPVRELISEGQTGLLAPFHDPAELARRALEVLRDPPAYRHLAQAGYELILREYALDRILPRLIAFYRSVAASPPRGSHIAHASPSAGSTQPDHKLP